MSESESQAISVLLPDANVAVFSKDQQTLEAAKGIETDWRFARVSIDIQEGDAQAAAQAYIDKDSPDLLIIQTEEMGESFTDQLEALAGSCDENTAAIIIGPDNDVNLYRKLIDMGVSDYLVKPLETPVLADVMARILIERLGVSGSNLIALIGSKGGVGVSVLSQALATGVSDIFGQKTLLLDAAGGRSSLSVGMSFEPSSTLQEACKAAANNDEDSLERMIQKLNDKLGVLASGSEAILEGTIGQEQFEHLLDVLMNKYPVVLVDLSSSSASLQNAVVRRANEIILVSTPTLPSLRLARSLYQEIKELRGGNKENVELVINMQGVAPSSEVSKSDIEAAMECTPLSLIPFDTKLLLAHESDGKKVIDDKAGQDLIRNALLPALKGVVPGDPNAGKQDEASDNNGALGGLLKKLASK